MAQSNAIRADYQESQVNPVFSNYIPNVEDNHRKLFMKYAAGQNTNQNQEIQKTTMIPQTRKQLQRINSGSNLFSPTNYPYNENPRNLTRYGSGSNLLQYQTTYKEEPTQYIPQQTIFKTSGVEQKNYKISEVEKIAPAYLNYPKKNQYKYNLFSMIDQPYNRCCEAGKCGSCPSNQCYAHEKPHWYNN